MAKQLDQDEPAINVPDDSDAIRRAIIQHLESVQRAGLDFVPAGRGNFRFELDNSETIPMESAEPVETAVRENKNTFPDKKKSPDTSVDTTAQRRSQPRPGEISSYGGQVDPSQKPSELAVIQQEVAECMKCEELCHRRTQTVFGVGDPSTRLVFVGEGPGADEDRQGEPFVGAAGQLLDKIIGACKLSRHDVYILNTVKCRPPGNRNPNPTELSNCWGYAERQLEVIQPEFICCLGSVAARTVLNTTQSIGKLRRKFHSYRGSKVLVTYHPAYLLRTPSAKKHVWEDMKLLMAEMGVEL